MSSRLLPAMATLRRRAVRSGGSLRNLPQWGWEKTTVAWLLGVIKLGERRTRRTSGTRREFFLTGSSVSAHSPVRDQRRPGKLARTVSTST